MLKNDFVPVAIDQWYQRQQKDAEGDFYRTVASQGPLNDLKRTTQGRYVCAPDGTLLGYSNHYGPKKIRLIMKLALGKFKPDSSASTKPIESGVIDEKFAKAAPKNGMLVRVNSKILLGSKSKSARSAKSTRSTTLPFEQRKTYFKESTGRDNLWFKESEIVELAKWLKSGGEMPTKLAQRLARFHLVDNTRGEPPRWKVEEIKSLSITVEKSGIVKGKLHLETADGKRGYQASVYGIAKVDSNDGRRISQFDLVAKGEFWGRGPYTGYEPKGKFPLAIAFRIGDGSDPADAILPHGTKGWLPGYYQ